MAEDSHGMGIPVPPDSTPVHQFPAVARDGLEKVAEILAGGLTPATEAAVTAQAGAAVAAELANAGVVTGGSSVDSADVVFSITDSENRRSWLEIGHDGGPSTHAAGIVKDTALAGEVLPEPLASTSDYLFGITDENGRATDLTVGHDGKLAPFVVADLKERIGVVGGVDVPDSINEWSYVLPLACNLTKPFPRIVGGSIGSGGGRGTLAPIYAWEWIPGIGVKQVEVGKSPADDHNTPSVLAEDGWRTVLIWTDHGYSASTIPGAVLPESLGSLHLVVSDQAGSIESMATCPITHIPTADNDGSYAATYRIRHLCSYTADGRPAVGVYWSVFRALAGSWWIAEITVDQATGAVSYVVKQLITNPKKYYLTTAEVHGAAQQTLRFGTYPHPQEDTHAVHYFEMNCVTGAISSPVDPAMAANYNTRAGMPLDIAAFTPLLPDYATAGTHSRRLIAVRPGPAAPAVLYADWELAKPDEAVYKVKEVGGAITDHGVAGPRIGYFDWANYLGGANFPNPAYDKTLVVTRYANRLSQLEERRVARDGTIVATVLAESTAHRIARPFQSYNGSPAGWLYNAITRYDPEGYRDYSSTIKSTRNEG